MPEIPTKTKTTIPMEYPIVESVGICLKSKELKLLTIWKIKGARKLPHF